MTHKDVSETKTSAKATARSYVSAYFSTQADALSELAVAVAEVAVFGHDLHESLHTAPSLRSKEGS